MKKLFYFLLALPVMFAAAACNGGNNGDDGEQCTEYKDPEPDKITGLYYGHYHITMNGETTELMDGHFQFNIEYTTEGVDDKISLREFNIPSMYNTELSPYEFNNIKVEGIALSGEAGNLSLEFNDEGEIYVHPTGTQKVPIVVAGTLKKIEGTRVLCDDPSPQSKFQELNMTITTTIDMKNTDGDVVPFDIVYTISPLVAE